MCPRLKKPRICTCPFRGSNEVYKPADLSLRELEQVTLYCDEIEARFLCDGENISQEEAG